MNGAARGPLAHRDRDLARICEAAGISVREVSLLSQIDLRMQPDASSRLPFAVPTTPNTTARSGELVALWLGPDEWLVVGPPGTASSLVRELTDALAGVHHSVVDVSANRAVLELSGAERLSLLSIGCGLDLHPRFWTAGMCAQTLLASVQVLLHESSDATRLLFRPSFGDHIVDWLLDATARRARHRSS